MACNLIAALGLLTSTTLASPTQPPTAELSTRDANATLAIRDSVTDPACLVDKRLPAWHYVVGLDAKAPGVNTDCGETYLSDFRSRCGAITSWWCHPFAMGQPDASGKYHPKEQALSDSDTNVVILDFWTAATCNPGDIAGAVWDGSDQKISIPCNEYSGDPNDEVLLPPIMDGFL